MQERELVAVVITADGRKVPMPLDALPTRSLLDRVRRRIRELAARRS